MTNLCFLDFIGWFELLFKSMIESRVLVNAKLLSISIICDWLSGPLCLRLSCITFIFSREIEIFEFKFSNLFVLFLELIILFRFLESSLKKKNHINIRYLNELEEKVIVKITKNLNNNDILNLIELLYKEKKNMIDFNLDVYTSIYATLTDIERVIRKNEK